MTMAQSMNTTVEYTTKASFLNGLGSVGDVLVGERAFEFYNQRNPEDYVQIPWDEVDYIAASLVFGKKIPRFAIFTFNNGHFSFSAQDNKALLRAITEHVPADKLVKSPSFFQVIGAGLKGLWKLVAKPFSK